MTMTHDELRKLATRARDARMYQNWREAADEFRAAANPKTVLELLDRIAELEGLLSEYNEDFDALGKDDPPPAPISFELAEAQAKQCEAAGHSVFWRGIRTSLHSPAAVKSAAGEWIGTIGLDGRFIPNYRYSVRP